MITLIAKQKTEAPTTVPEQLKLADGRIVDLLFPNMNADQKLAVISHGLLKRLVDLLPDVTFNDVKDQFIFRMSLAKNMEEYIGWIADELDFHKSVNMVNEFFMPPACEMAEATPVARRESPMMAGN